jgi:GntR family transcriptional regulator, transcriptional repressor for pyruvate dehydrogenase complex
MVDESAATLMQNGSQRLADVVYAQMVRLISRGEFPKDFKLPTEAELSARFGVSRPVIREALAQLRDEGYVRSHRGSGTVVIRGPRQAAVALPPVRTVVDLLRSYEFRITIETATAVIAAERRTDENIEEIRRILAEAKELLSEGLYDLLPDVNFSFHRAIARATQNPYYTHTLELMPNFVGRSTLDFAGPGGTQPAQRAERVHREHEEIFAAICVADPARARSEMERHILAARDMVLERQLVPSSPEVLVLSDR